jgi:23S rRNA (cytidine2498-2'-O)-methyltransferase
VPAFRQLIFPRQWARGSFIELPETDRISVLEHLAELPVCGSLWLEVVDTNDGKELSTFCRKFEVPLRKALEKAGRLVDDAQRRACC